MIGIVASQMRAIALAVGVGMVWVLRTTPVDDKSWGRVCWAPELGVAAAVGYSGTGNRAMTSLNGIDWTGRATWRSLRRIWQYRFNTSSDNVGCCCGHPHRCLSLSSTLDYSAPFSALCALNCRRNCLSPCKGGHHRCRWSVARNSLGSSYWSGNGLCASINCPLSRRAAPS